jgi:3-mercaptopyruvate sulfurtransferase SseA
MNHEKVSVLDGGLPRYHIEGQELDAKSLSSEAEALARMEQVCIPIKRFILKADPLERRGIVQLSSTVI